MQQCCFDSWVLVNKTSGCLFVRTCALETVQIDNAASNFFRLTSESAVWCQSIKSLLLWKERHQIVAQLFQPKRHQIVCDSFGSCHQIIVALLSDAWCSKEQKKTYLWSLWVQIWQDRTVFSLSELVTKILGGTGCHIPIWSLINVEQDSRGSHFAPI